MLDIESYTTASSDGINEDFFLWEEVSPGVMAVVAADGMGGLARGYEAAKLASESIVSFLMKYYGEKSKEDLLVESLLYANGVIAHWESSLHIKSGTSIAVVLIDDSECCYTWIGDVRIYHSTANGIELMTDDHVLKEGNHMFLTRSLNGKPFRHQPEARAIGLNHGVEIIMATDGYYLNNDILGGTTDIEVIDDDATFILIKFKQC